MDYINAFKHFSERLKERFSQEITYEHYINNLIRKRTLDKKYIGKHVRYMDGEKVYVYLIYKKVELPITVYKLDRINKGRVLKTLS